jgi:maleate cis-trans isomerase
MIKRLQRIGQIVPCSNNTMETEIYAVAIPWAGAPLSRSY